MSRTEAGAVLLMNSAPIAPNSSWQIELKLPPDATSAQIPPGSAKSRPRLPKARRSKCARRGLTWPRWWARFWWELRPDSQAITYWYLRGSRRLRERLGNYRTEPPSKLPPGVVNYLVEGKMTSRGILASVLHLADLGLVQLQRGSAAGNGRAPGNIVN